MTATSMRPLRFIGDSLKVLRELPEEVKTRLGLRWSASKGARCPRTPSH